MKQDVEQRDVERDAMTRFKVGVTRDMRGSDGRAIYPLDLLDQEPAVDWEFLPELTGELTAADFQGCDAMIVEHPRVPAAALATSDPPLLIARTGVGVDGVDIEACTAAGVMVTTTPDSVRRPMASSAMAFLLALSHWLPQRERSLRAGQWEIYGYIGTALTGRTLGVLGAGNIGRDVCRLAAPFDMEMIAYDPYAKPFDGVTLVDLDTLLERADFLVITCPLTKETYHLLDESRIAQMKPGAYVINVARGQIIDQSALTAALADSRLAGAGLDVMEQEPIDPDDPLLALDNVILTPHGIGMNDEIMRVTGESAARSVLEVATGRRPQHLLNPGVLDHPRLRERFGAPEGDGAEHPR
ncbi:MAG: NAD(P)-dependent oxidoreductase [Nocardioides sp.]|uniref:NAD(P)-dependent oxidoreductase n=1 Tax=Nocardioides sp. TaxID=35761 RepID=UPI0039E36D85